MQYEKTYVNNPDSLFRKYADVVTWLANTQLGRDYLKDNNLFIPSDSKIALLLPSGYISQLDETEKHYKLTVTTKPCYSKRIYPALIALDLVSGWLNNYEEAQRVVLGYLGLISYGRMPSVARSLSFLTVTKNPDAHPETTSFDGTCGRSGVNETFSTLMAGAGNTSADTVTGPSCPYVASSGTTNQFGNNQRALYLFDTSSLTSVATINTATLSLYGFTAIDNQFGGTNPSYDVVEAVTASNVAASNSDYENMLNTLFGSVAWASWTISGYNNFTLNASGITSIKKTGISKFGGKLSWDRTNTFGGVWSGGFAARFDNYQADFGSNKPKLEINYDLIVSVNYLRQYRRTRFPGSITGV